MALAARTNIGLSAAKRTCAASSSRHCTDRAPRRQLLLHSAQTDGTGAVTYSFNEQPSSATTSTTASTSTSTSSLNSNDSPPSPVNPPGSSSSTSSTVQSTVTSTKLALLERVAGLDRGALATYADKQEVERLVKVLEEAAAAAGAADPFNGRPAAVEGRWELIYTNTEVFRASPFFLAFQNGLVQNDDVAKAIFRFTDAIPGAEIRAAYQTISLLSGSLISEVDMAVFPGLTGTVVTSSRAIPQGSNTLQLTIESTRVTSSTFSPFLDGVAVPVEQLINALRGEGATQATYTFTFIDSNLRITRAGAQLLLHRRVL